MAEYRIDELARAAGTTARNVRVYQDRELLPAPRRSGRTALYSDAHLVRLRLIRNMLERGYAFAQIKEMLDAWQAGRGLGDLLGLEQVVGRSWAQEAPRVLAADELHAAFGGQFTGSNVDRAAELGLLERHGADFLVPSPQLLTAGAELVRLGVPLGEVLELAGQLQGDIDHVAGLLVRVVREHVLGTADDLDRDADVAQRLRPLVTSALNAAAARSADRVIPQLLGDRIVDLFDRDAGRDPS
ncbi:MerR family transcriptional regulator [Saccharopolyspora sp. HNM0983]|uniref:MerR family transcriptional regulator n=1 Tax=Saccharopolyspora montiporae TaxID=2781240 RepID=A0A929BB05_9PSEU|nr:MerR family transcriptional regulator [Saccharopolyspora sp. HNM0983]